MILSLQITIEMNAMEPELNYAQVLMIIQKEVQR